MQDNRILRFKKEGGFGMDFVIAPRIYSLYENSVGKHYVIHSRLYEDGKRRRKRRTVDSATVLRIVGEMRSLNLPLPSEGVMVCDAGLTTLCIDDVEMRWWTGELVGSERLEELISELLDLFDAALDPQRS